MKRIYVAGAYSGDDLITCLKNIGRGEEFSARVFMMGHAPFCPWHDKDFVLRHWEADFTYEAFYRYSMAWLEVSDAVLVIPGWEASKGTRAEITRAIELGIPVYYSLEELEEYA